MPESQIEVLSFISTVTRDERMAGVRIDGFTLVITTPELPDTVFFVSPFALCFSSRLPDEYRSCQRAALK